jgi:hypothetical protein
MDLPNEIELYRGPIGRHGQRAMPYTQSCAEEHMNNMVWHCRGDVMKQLRKLPNRIRTVASALRGLAR